jgi:flagellar biosynthesis protein FliQ
MWSSLFALSAFPAAALAWPKRAPRRAGRMVVAGLITVILSLVLLGLFLGLFIGIMEGENVVQVLGNTLGMIATITVFGSVFTLGIPYLFGALLSVPFSNSRQ